MASYRKKKNRDGYEVYFYGLDKRRKSVWLQEASLRQARDFTRHVDELIRARKAGLSPEADTAKWIDDLEGHVRERLVALGLADASTHKRYEPIHRTVGAWTQAYIDNHTTNPRTTDNYKQAREWLLKTVDENADIATVTSDDLRKWQRSMKDKLAIATRNKHIQRARTMFAAACEARLIRSNPADVLKQERLPAGRRIDRSRQKFIDNETSKKVLAKLSPKWQAIFALLRYQGMRRHEALGLKWEHVSLSAGVIQIHSLKTGVRECPIFPETRQYLEKLASKTEELQGKVIPWTGRVESLSPMLKVKVEAILGTAWPKICQQLRSTRRTELDELFPPHVVNEWLGHDSLTATKHYRQVTPEHQAKALALPNSCSTTGSTVSNSQHSSMVDSLSKIVIFPASGVESLHPQMRSNKDAFPQGNSTSAEVCSTTSSTNRLNSAQIQRLEAIANALTQEQFEEWLSIGESLASTKATGAESPEQLRRIATKNKTQVQRHDVAKVKQ